LCQITELHVPSAPDYCSNRAKISPCIPTFPVKTQGGKYYKAARIAIPAATKLPAPAISWPAAPVGEAKAEEEADEPAPPAEVALPAAEVAAGLLEVVAGADVLATVDVEATVEVAVEEGLDEAAVVEAAVVETGAEEDAVLY
jgi:hypothetical protein